MNRRLHRQTSHPLKSFAGTCWKLASPSFVKKRKQKFKEDQENGEGFTVKETKSVVTENKTEVSAQAAAPVEQQG